MLLEVKSRLRRGAGVAALGALAVSSGCATVSTQQEVALGADYSRQINRQLPLINDASTVNYINTLGRRIAAANDPRGLRYTFYVVNSDQINAFAVPGGYIYINRGVIERSANESELAGVLAHEIGHVVERHSIEQLERAQGANTLLSILYGGVLRRNPGGLERAGVQLGGQAIFAGYSRDAEREADRDAIAFLVRVGISPRGLPTFFQKLLAEKQRNPSRVAQWFATHPTTEERISSTQALINQTPGANNASLASNSSSFASVQSRVRSLSPQPADRGRTAAR
jgi:beta-barrel assembly-enhancing protease